MHRPSFFIAGHSKSGTTALAMFLRQHPEIFICDPMEPNFFCPSWCRADGPPSHFFRRTEEEYLSLFDRAAPRQLCGEASAVYLYSPEAAARIHDFDPDARIIMVFREPVDFLRSYHLQLLRNVPTEGETVAGLPQAVSLEPRRLRGECLPEGCLIPELLRYSTDRLAYADHFDRFAARFPRNQILALLYDDFRRDNIGTVRRVLRFLGVDVAFTPRLAEHNSGGAALRSRSAAAWLHRATHAQGMLGAVRRRLPRRLRRRAVELAYRNVAFRAPRPLDPRFVEEIRARARPQVTALGERLGRDLDDEWGNPASIAARELRPVSG
jgi:hypothetical protein